MFWIVVFLVVAELVLYSVLRSREFDKSKVNLFHGGYNFGVGALLYWFTDFTFKYNADAWDLYDYGEFNEGGVFFSQLQAIGVIYLFVGIFLLIRALYEKIGESAVRISAVKETANADKASEDPTVKAQTAPTTKWKCDTCFSMASGRDKCEYCGAPKPRK